MTILLITILGLVLRLILSGQSFWLDEGASLMFAKLSLPQLVDAIKTDFHPPIFYSLLHFWLPLAGRTEWLIRLPFIIIATAAVPALYLLCREIFGPKSPIPVISALFLAFNPLHIYYSQELRMYSLVTLLVILSWYYLIKKNHLLASLFNFLGLFTFYGAIFNAFSQLLYLFVSGSKEKLRSVFILVAPSLLAFLFWWPVFSAQLSNGDYLKNVLPGWQTLSGSLTLKSLLLIPLKFIFGRISLTPQGFYFLVGGVLVILFLIILAPSFKNKKSMPIRIALLTPLILGTLISLKTPVLGYWRFLFVLPFFLTLLAVGLESLPKLIYRGTIVWICGVFLFSNIYFWTNPKFRREDWRGLATLLSGKNSLVLFAFPYKFAPLNFYHPGAEYLPMMGEDYQLKPQFKTEFNGKAFGHETVYYLDYLADLTDPNRVGLQSLTGLGLKQTGVYNFTNLGQVFEFRRL